MRDQAHVLPLVVYPTYAEERAVSGEMLGQ